VVCVQEVVMALGRKNGESQGELWVATKDVARSPGHVFYRKLNTLLAEAGFDAFVEELCEPFYAKAGRPGIPPGTYIRMLFVGYFEGIDSQRGIAWRCQDSLSLREFLGVKLTDNVPDHSSLTRIRDRLPIEVVQQVFAFVLKLASEQKLISAAQVGVDATLLEANAAMKSIVRRETAEDWQAYVIRLMREEGVIDEEDEPTDAEVRKFDKKRKGKKVSNQDWKSPVDEEARIVRMKDGRTHLGYKAEHTVDLETEVILSATVQSGTEPDSRTLLPAVVDAQINLIHAASEAGIQEVVADKGYHANQQIADCAHFGLRTYIPEPNSPHNRNWTDKPEQTQRAVLNNRRRLSRSKGQALQKQRSEKVERSFAHVCETGGARRTWLRGLEKINKRYQLVVAAHNLGIVMRKLLGTGKPRGQGVFGQLSRLFSQIIPARNPTRCPNSLKNTVCSFAPHISNWHSNIQFVNPKLICSTGC
jgi:transposase